MEDPGEGQVVVESGKVNQHGIPLDGCCAPYVVIGEELLTKYWNIKDTRTKWTLGVAPNGCFDE